jgi:endonuclease/exonuclease/phosphatase family metal-dependent hydrolase
VSGGGVRAASRSVVVASYNVHGCIGTDRRRDVLRVARVLRELAADVIALQEIDWHANDAHRLEAAEILSEVAGMRAIWAPTRHQRGELFGNALLTSLAVRSARTFDLTYAQCEPRRALDVELETGATPLRVIATHLGLRPRERRFQVQRILERAAHDERATTVLLGDINEWFIAGRPLRWLHAHFGFVPHLRTFPSFFPVFALDRIWAHPPPAISEMWRHVTPQSRRASDHLPVVARLELGVPTPHAAP